jgi:prevent-host-death family protein
METLPITEVENRFTELADRAEREHDHFTVTRNGRPAVVVVSIAEWESLHETLSILADPDEISAIREGLADDAHGDVFSSEEVAAAMAGRKKPAG